MSLIYRLKPSLKRSKNKKLCIGESNVAQLIMGEDWGALSLHFELHPESARQPVQIGGILGTDISWSCLPLHAVACSVKPSIKVLRSLLNAYPEACKMIDRDGALPLHYACFKNQSKKFIEMLLEHYPRAARVKNTAGYLPLHLSCFRGAPLAEIKVLLRYNPKAVGAKDTNGELPIHAACSGKASLQVVSLLLDANRKSVFHVNRDGMTPLDLAKGKMVVDPKMVEILEKGSDSWKLLTKSSMKTIDDYLEDTALEISKEERYVAV